MSEVTVEIKVRNKEKFLGGIEKLASVSDSVKEHYPYLWHYSVLKEALTEACIFFYSSIPEEKAAGMFSTFISKADEAVLSASINHLWAGTAARQSTEYHKALFNILSSYAVENGFAEFTKKLEEQKAAEAQKTVADPLASIFNLAEDAKKSAAATRDTARTIANSVYKLQ